MWPQAPPETSFASSEQAALPLQVLPGLGFRRQDSNHLSSVRQSLLLRHATANPKAVECKTRSAVEVFGAVLDHL